MTPSTFGALVRNIVLAILAIGAALLIAAAWPMPARAQPAAASAAASAASAPADPITYDSACGAPGVGKSIRDERLIMGAFEGQRVNARGYWEAGCVPPPPPKDCADMPAPRWFSQGAWCDPLQPVIHAGNLGQVRRVNQAEFRGGWRDYQCLQRADGVKRWVPLRSTCR